MLYEAFMCEGFDSVTHSLGLASLLCARCLVSAEAKLGNAWQPGAPRKLVHQRGRFIDGKGCLAYFIIRCCQLLHLRSSGLTFRAFERHPQHAAHLRADLQHALMGAIRMSINIGYMLASLRDAKPRQYTSLVLTPRS